MSMVLSDNYGDSTGFKEWLERLESEARDLRELGYEPYKVHGEIVWRVPGVEDLLTQAEALEHAKQ